MSELILSLKDQNATHSFLDRSKVFCKEHQWELGACEMASGAAIFAWGVKTGAIQMGVDVVASALSRDDFGLGETLGIAGTGIGALGGYILGGIGVVAMGSGVGIPAALVIGGGALIFGALGYAGGELTEKFLAPTLDYGTLFSGTSALSVGLWLMIDGARRVIKDQDFLNTASWVKENSIHFANITRDVVASTLEELKTFIKTFPAPAVDKIDAAGTFMSSTGAATVGGAIGLKVAVGSVTVLGSHVLGGVALSLGLASVPLWPVLACGVVASAVGLTGWKVVRFAAQRKTTSPEGPMFI